MVEFELSQDEKIFQETVREFLQEKVMPKWHLMDEEKRIPTELLKELGKQGFYAITVPEEYGGQGGRFLDTVIVAEQLGYHDPSMALAVFTLLNNAWPFILYKFGEEDVKKKILGKVGVGEGFFGIASTEPRGGSDVAGLQTRAEKKGGEYRVFGEKTFISGVREAMEQLDLGGWLLLARTGSLEERHKGLTAFAFVANNNGKTCEGFSYSILEMAGRHAISTGTLYFDGAPIPEKNVVGGVGKGFYVGMEGFNIARILVAAANVGSSQWALEKAVEWVRERRLFDNKPIAGFQGVSFPIAEIALEIEATRLLVYKAAWKADRIYFGNVGEKPVELARYSAMAKLKAVETAGKTYRMLMRTMGALSYTKESNIYRAMLGNLSYMVGAEGAQNIMKYIIARDIIGKDYVK